MDRPAPPSRALQGLEWRASVGFGRCTPGAPCRRIVLRMALGRRDTASARPDVFGDEVFPASFVKGDRVPGARRIALLQCVSDRAPAVRTGLRSYMLQNRSFGRRAAPFAAEQKLRPGVSSTSVSPNGSRTRKRRGIAAKNPILPRIAGDRLSGSAPRSHGHAHAWLVIRAQRRQPAAHAVAHAWLARCRWRRRCRRRQSHAHARFVRALGRLTGGG